MITRSWFIAILLLARCGGGDSAGSLGFPPSLDGGWPLAETEPIDTENTPPGVQELGLLQARRGRYQGPGQLTVVIYEMTNQSAAFELAQLWRPAESMLAFPAGVSFVLLESDSLTNTELNELAGVLEQLWGFE